MNLILLILLLAVIPLQSFAEGSPWAIFESLAFNKTSAAVELREMKYLQDEGKVVIYQIDLKSWKTTLIDKKTYEANFATAKKSAAKKLEWAKGPSLIHLSSGENLRFKYESCNIDIEGGSICKKQILTLDEAKFSLDPPCEGCEIVTAFKWDQQLWLGLASLGEYSRYGKGFRVEDLKTKKSIFTYSESVMGGQLPSIMMLDPTQTQMWIATNIGISVYDKSFKRVRECRLAVPIEYDGIFKFGCDN